MKNPTENGTVMDKSIADYIDRHTDFGLISISGNRKGKTKKITVRPVETKDGRIFQAESIAENKAYHVNLEKDELIDWLSENAGDFRQYVVGSPSETATFLVSKKGKINLSLSAGRKEKQDCSHDRKKDRILRPEEGIPALADLGVTTPDGKIIKSKSDKFRQIDRFVRIIAETVTDAKDGFTILDFGCGKSYLTFIIYWYFTAVRGIKVRIVGYDLKKDVVDFCNETARRYGYENLVFNCGDVNKTDFPDKVDMIVSLHACDKATDAALYYAVKKGVRYVFSVPCCQHEINLSVHEGGDLDILLTDGIIRDRTCALLTDAIRTDILRHCGYEVGILEFVEFAHSPKNRMLKAVFTGKKKPLPDIDGLMKRYGFTQELWRRLSEDGIIDRK